LRASHDNASKTAKPAGSPMILRMVSSASGTANACINSMRPRAACSSIGASTDCWICDDGRPVVVEVLLSVEHDGGAEFVHHLRHNDSNVAELIGDASEGVTRHWLDPVLVE
jgi:hypothetical protein